MNNYMVTYFYASTAERLKNADTRYPEIVYTEQNSFQDAYNEAMAYARRKHGYKTAIAITAISNLSATSMLAEELSE